MRFLERIHHAFSESAELDRDRSGRGAGTIVANGFALRGILETTMAMDQAIDAVRLERLMAELDWIRRLARALTHDAAADDAAQDAWLLAAQHPPDEARPQA